MSFSAFYEFFSLYKRYGKPHLRMGQFFVSRYIKQPWPELFYERDAETAQLIIEAWLLQYQYEFELPLAIYKVEEQPLYKELQDDEALRKDMHRR